MSTAVKEAPKDEQVAEEVKARQLPLFDGHKVRRIEAQMKSGDLALADPKEVPEYGAVRYFVVKARVSEVMHKEKKSKGSKFGLFTRIAGFEVQHSAEIDEGQARDFLYPKK